MSVESLMQTCADLRIKLALKGDNSDRLQVDAPKGTLTAPLREALAASKGEIIALLKSQQSASATQTEAISANPDDTVTSTPEATRSMPTKKQANQSHQLDSSELEVN